MRMVALKVVGRGELMVVLMAKSLVVRWVVWLVCESVDEKVL
jgi:hypothetical protein